MTPLLQLGGLAVGASVTFSVLFGVGRSATPPFSSNGFDGRVPQVAAEMLYRERAPSGEARLRQVRCATVSSPGAATCFVTMLPRR